MPVKYDPNTLWVALNKFGDGNIFEVYPKLLAQLFLQEEAARQDGDTSEAEKLVLPSDRDYRLQKYFVLVELQKELEEDEDGNKVAKPLQDPMEEWAPWSFVVATKNPQVPPPVPVKTIPGPAWDIGQVLKAARLLCKPPLPVDFASAILDFIFGISTLENHENDTLDAKFANFCSRHFLYKFLPHL